MYSCSCVQCVNPLPHLSSKNVPLAGNVSAFIQFYMFDTVSSTSLIFVFPILNLMLAKFFNQVGTGATRDWESCGMLPISTIANIMIGNEKEVLERFLHKEGDT